MKVKEVIEKLQTMPPESICYWFDPDGGEVEVEDVYLSEIWGKNVEGVIIGYQQAGPDAA